MAKILRFDVRQVAGTVPQQNTLWYWWPGATDPDYEQVSAVLTAHLADSLAAASWSSVLYDHMVVSGYDPASGQPDDNIPYIYEAMTFGGARGGNLSGPYQTATLTFGMGSLLISSTPSALGRAFKRSYLAFGPLLESDIDNTGALVSGTLDLLEDLGEDLATAVEADGEVMAPIRVRLETVGAWQCVTQWRHVVSCGPRAFSGTRKSRYRRA